MGIRLTTDADLTSVANAIRTAGGTNASLTFPTGFVNAIGAIQSGGGSSGGSKGDVTFYDYDGTIVTSYSAAEFANLSALPANPTHSGLTAQGWNWSLVDAKTYVAKHGKLNIGQMYVTNDGKTRLYIHIEDVARNVVPLYWYQSESNGVTINWGDGSTEETFSDTENLNTTHTYASMGDYVITLDVTSGTAKLGYGTNSYAVLGSTSNNNNIIYLNMLKKVEIGNNMYLYDYTFYKCYSLVNILIPNSITEINSYTFDYCYSLTNVTIPDSVTYIGNYAFRYCYSLTNVTIPDSVTYIGSCIFRYCYSLSSITISDNVTNVGNNAFDSCSSLANISIPDSVIRIGSNTFSNCYSLTDITIPDGVIYIESSAFQYCHSLKSIIIHDSVTTIGNYAFRHCYSLTSVIIPDDVTSIGNYAFQYCYSLSSITIPDNVTSIGDSAFDSCFSLASITIPDSVTSIGACAFQYCYGMKECHLLHETPPTLSNTNAFGSIPSDCIIYVPYSTDHSILEAYKTASNWSDYADYMQEEPQS